MQECQLPPEFSALVNQVKYVQQKNSNEYCSSCPRCGGDVHPNGDWPDRFTMWISSHKTGKPYGVCLRGHCGHRWSQDMQDAPWAPDDIAEFQAKREEVAAKFDAETEERLKLLSERISEQGLVERYYQDAQKSPAAIAYWEQRGIPAGEWQAHLRLGVMLTRVVGRLSTYNSEAYTIPIFSEANRIENIKLRIAQPKCDADRFRNCYKSKCQHLYSPLHGKPAARHGIFVEGEVKSDVVAIRGNVNPNQYDIWGTQSKQIEERLLRKIKAMNYDCIYFAMDWDAYEPTQWYDQQTGELKFGQIPVLQMARQVGVERVRLLVPPKNRKYDDMILRGYNFANAVNMAIKPERLSA